MIVAFMLEGDKGSAHDQQANKKKKSAFVILESEGFFFWHCSQLDQ